MPHYLYILRCKNNELYIGITSKLNERCHYHSSGSVKYTKNRRPIILVYFEEFESKEIAALREKQIKGWTRVKKENLIKFGVPYKSKL
jgi:putative endonuclease